MLGIFLPFVALVVGSLGYMAVFAKTLYENPNGLLPLMLLGLVLGLFWLLWMTLASALRRLLSGHARTRKRE
jgi:hypothetical protein